MSVAIIGAGVSGLCTAKALRDRGIEHTVFEASDDVGGNWYFGNPNGRSSAYRSLHIDTSKDRISFADYPMPASYPDFPHHAEIHAWLRSFADEFGLRENIRFGTEVRRAERVEGGGWDIDGERFDSLVVCNGHHWDPRFPSFPGTFDGPAIHSHHYIDTRDPVDVHDKRVLVVGIGNSAVDICSEVSRKGVAARTSLSTRSVPWVLPKYICGGRADTRCKTTPRLPLAFQRRMGALLQRIVSGKPEDFGLPKPNHRFLEAHPTVSSELLLRLGSGDATAKPDVVELLGDRVRFADGSVEQIDVIVYATGYNISFPFFEPAFLSAPENELPLYKRMFKPGIGDLVFVGLGQAIPTIFPFAELQAKVMGRYFAGEYALPSPAEMQRTIAADERKHRKHFSNKPRHTMQLDWYVYEDDMTRREIPAGRERAGAQQAGATAVAAPGRAASTT